MIEIEKKFILTDAQKKRLLEKAEFLGEKTFIDVYYDTPEYALTKNDIWLRARDGNFELKLPLQKNEKGLTNQYHEIEGEEKIRQIFGIVPKGNFLEDIQSFGYAAFCECKTTRKKYRKEKFIIDLDEVIFHKDSAQGGSNHVRDFKYSIAEIELIIASEGEIKKANDEILAFADLMGLENKNLRGKVLEYLLRHKPEHYKALVDAGVVIK